MLLKLSRALFRRWRAIRHERYRARVLEGVIDTVRANYDRGGGHGAPDFQIVYNAALYLLVFDRDFSVLKIQMYDADTAWARRFVARQMAVALTEACDDLSELLGKEFRGALSRLQLTSEDSAKIDSASRAFHEFRRTHEVQLRTLRNSLGAHRQLKVAIQLDQLAQLEPLEVYAVAAEFYASFRRLLEAMTVLVQHMGHPSVILKQLTRNARPDGPQ